MIINFNIIGADEKNLPLQLVKEVRVYQILVSRKNEKNIIALIENGILVEKYEETIGKRLEGNIYIGKVQNILKKMQVAFVDMGEEKNAFIHLKDALPKLDEKKEQKTEIHEINSILKVGMPILVQVKRDSTSQKGARISTHINLTGKYIVFLPNANFITTSQKIENAKEKERLVCIAKKILPTGTGAIIRTSAINKQETDLKNDLDILIDKWNKITQMKLKNYPKLVYKNDSLIKKLLTDLIEKEIETIIVDNKENLEEVSQALKEYGKENQIHIRYVSDALKEAGIEEKIEKLKNRKIWLKCGGFITIDKTEALTAIDVNSAKFTGAKDLETTAYMVNLEATDEITRQLKLRDIGGIIIIDYIDMLIDGNKQKIQQRLIQNLKTDRAKTQVEGFTKLNLMELTRKHICNEE